MIMIKRFAIFAGGMSASDLLLNHLGRLTAPFDSTTVTLLTMGAVAGLFLILTPDA